MGRTVTGYRTCKVCKKSLKLKRNFYIRRTRTGNLNYDRICKKCQSKLFLQRYSKARDIIKELGHVKETATYIEEQECVTCIFLGECNYLVKVAKSEKNPYCFEDSPLHHRYLKQYGKG